MFFCSFTFSRSSWRPSQGVYGLGCSHLTCSFRAYAFPATPRPARSRAWATLDRCSPGPHSTPRTCGPHCAQAVSYPCLPDSWRKRGPPPPLIRLGVVFSFSAHKKPAKNIFFGCGLESSSSRHAFQVTSEPGVATALHSCQETWSWTRPGFGPQGPEQGSVSLQGLRDHGPGRWGPTGPSWWTRALQSQWRVAIRPGGVAGPPGA